MNGTEAHHDKNGETTQTTTNVKIDLQLVDNNAIKNNNVNQTMVQTVSEGNETVYDYPDDEINTNIGTNNDIHDNKQAPSQQIPIDKNHHNQQQHPQLGQEKEEYQWNDADIQRDAATQNVAMVVHFALAFFAALVVLAGVMILVVVSEFGLVAFISLVVMASFLGGIGCFVNHILKNEVQLRPVRRKIRRWKALTTAVVIQEMRNFQLDWHEHLLLTDGTETFNNGGDYYYNINDTNDVVGGDNKNCSSNGVGDGDASSSSMHQNHKVRGASRSVVFGLVVKPFLKVKGFRKRKMHKKQERKQQQQQQQQQQEKASQNENGHNGNGDTTSYIPPTDNNDVNDIV